MIIEIGFFDLFFVIFATGLQYIFYNDLNLFGKDITQICYTQFILNLFDNKIEI